jgi:hypothetical protein
LPDCCGDEIKSRGPKMNAGIAVKAGRFRVLLHQNRIQVPIPHDRAKILARRTAYRLVAERAQGLLPRTPLSEFYTPLAIALLAYLCGISSTHKAWTGCRAAQFVCSNRKYHHP